MIGRSVVDDDHVIDMAERLDHDAADKAVFVIGRNDGHGRLVGYRVWLVHVMLFLVMVLRSLLAF